jgi:hypothetical protein
MSKELINKRERTESLIVEPPTSVYRPDSPPASSKNSESENDTREAASAKASSAAAPAVDLQSKDSKQEESPSGDVKALTASTIQEKSSVCKIC